MRTKPATAACGPRSGQASSKEAGRLLRKPSKNDDKRTTDKRVAVQRRGGNQNQNEMGSRAEPNKIILRPDKRREKAYGSSMGEKSKARRDKEAGEVLRKTTSALLKIPRVIESAQESPRPAQGNAKEGKGDRSSTSYPYQRVSTSREHKASSPTKGNRKKIKKIRGPTVVFLY